MLPRALLACLVGLSALAGAQVPRPALVETSLPTTDVVIASLVLEPGEGDATGRIQAAIDRVAEAGGGVVFLRAGQYRIEGRLVLREGAVLRGDWAEPGQGAKGTILALRAGRGEPEATEIVTMERGSGLRELTFWFPEQDPSRPVPYPWVARTSRQTTGDNTTVMNVTVVNAWQGIRIGPEWNELHTVRNLFMTALKTGISIDSTTDIGRLNRVLVSPRVWEESALPGSPTGAAREACRAWQAKETTGIDIGRSDWEYVHDVVVEHAATGFVFRQGERGTTNAVMLFCKALDCGTGLRLERLNGVGLAVTGCELAGREQAIHAAPGFTTVATFHSCTIRGPRSLLQQDKALTSFQNCTFAGSLQVEAGQLAVLGSAFADAGEQVALGGGVERVRLLGNTFAGAPRIRNETVGADVGISHAPLRQAAPALRPHVPAPVPTLPRRALFLVGDYGADAGAPDNTEAFAKALEAARAAGGGTVYVPAGLYRFAGSLRVPTGVELRGCFDVPHHTVSAGSVLMPLGGRGDENGTPFVQLEARSGLRGLTFWYPEQSPAEPVPYPWTVRGLGPGCWLEDVTLGNSWQGVDLWSHDSTGHAVRYLAGCCLRRGIWVSKSAGPGWVEDVQFNPHYALRLHRSLPRAPIDGATGGTLIDFLRQNLEGMVFGRCADERIFATFLYAAYDGIAFRDDGGGANARVLIHGTDTASRAATLEATGARGLEFVAAQLVPLGKWEVAAIVATPTFAGKASFFNTQIWAGSLTADIQGSGELLVQQMNTLSGGFRLAGGKVRIENANMDRDLYPHLVVEGGRCDLLACQSRRGFLRWTAAPGAEAPAFGCSASLVGAMPKGDPGPGEFATGWEDGDPPAIADQIAQGGGRRDVGEARCQPIDAPGPEGGARVLKLSGTCVPGKHGFVYFRIADGPVAIYPDTILGYSIHPLNAEGAHVAVDAVLDSGPPLRDHRLVTTGKLSAHPGTAKGEVGEWTRIQVPLGALSGRTIRYLMFAYDHRFAEESEFACLLDDVRIDSELATAGVWRIAAEAKDGALVLRGPAAPLRYTTDGSNPGPDSPLYREPIPLPKGAPLEIRYALQRTDGSLMPLVFSHLAE